MPVKKQQKTTSTKSSSMLNDMGKKIEDLFNSIIPSTKTKSTKSTKPPTKSTKSTQSTKPTKSTKSTSSSAKMSSCKK